MTERKSATGRYQATYVTSTRQPCTGHWARVRTLLQHVDCHRSLPGYVRYFNTSAMHRPQLGYVRYVTFQTSATSHVRTPAVALWSGTVPGLINLHPNSVPALQGSHVEHKVAAGRYVLYGVHAAPITHLYNLHADAFTATAKTRNKPIVSVISPEVMKPDSTSAHKQIHRKSQLFFFYAQHSCLTAQRGLVSSDRALVVAAKPINNGLHAFHHTS